MKTVIEKMASKRPYSNLLEEFDRSMEIERKRKKSCGFSASHQFEHFNDVTAIAGLKLDEEQEQLFLGAKLNKVSKSPQNAVHQEEEMFLSRRTFLRAKLENMISKCGLKSVGKDVEDCLLLGLGKMMYELITNMTRMSKQRFNYEKKRHLTIVTSDIRRDIIIMNSEARDQKKSQVEKSNRDISDGEINKSAKSSSATKANKKKTGVDMMLQTAARTNKAVRASLGGDDFISKWMLLSNKAQQEEAAGKGAQPNEKMIKVLQGTEDRTQQDRFLMVPKRVVSMKDVIAVLERVPQMSKSSFMYSLYEKSAVAATTD